MNLTYLLIYRIISGVFAVYFVLLLLNVLLGWRRYANEMNTATRLVFAVTDPYLKLFRKLVPPKPGSRLDAAFIVAIIALWILEEIVKKVFFYLILF